MLIYCPAPLLMRWSAALALQVPSNASTALKPHSAAGSTDETMDWVEEAMRGVPGQLLEEPFQDFEYNRNHVLTSHGNATG